MSDNPGNLSLHQRLRFLAKDSILYGGAASFNKAFALLTFPVLARYLSVELYGFFDFLNVGVGLLAIIMVFGQDSAVARFFYDHKQDRPRQEIISQSLVFQFTLLVLVLLPLWFLANRVTTLIGKPGVSDWLVRLILLNVPFLVLINFSQNILKWTFSRTKFLIISIGSTVFTIGALLIGLIWFQFGLNELFSLFLVSRALFGLLGLWFCRQWLIWPEDWRFLKPLIYFALPYGIICTVSAFIPALERTFVVKYLDARDLGLFGAGAKIAVLISLPIQAFQVAWGPFSLAIHMEQNAHVTYNHALKVFTLSIVLLVMALTTVAEPVIQFLASSQYAGASIVVFPLAMGFALQGLSAIVSVGINLSKKSYVNLVSYAVYLLVSVVAIYSLIDGFGLLGVAWGSLFGRLAMSITESCMSWRVYPLPWAFARITACLIFVFAWCATGQGVTLQAGIIQGIIFNVIGLAILIPFGLLTLFSQQEREQIRKWAVNQLGCKQRAVR
ncbi:MAG TPA: oligosaccharide flippase family protein [Candidatus Paceibacterota bacterium]|nr:oligosaccharide flippase family protein [Candidatus Paceibacterota bacterium]